MGENKHIEELDTFAKKYVKEILTEEPSTNFTANVMNTVLAEKRKVQYQNTTNLKTSIWFVLGGFIIASVSLLIFGKSTKITMPKFEFYKFQVFDFEFMRVSQTTVYVFFFLTLLFFIQVYFMKNYFNKRFE